MRGFARTPRTEGCHDEARTAEKVPLFAGLSEHELERLPRWADEIDVPTGKRLINQGAFPHEFMVIEDGTAEVTHDGTHLADLGPGDFFGEMALLLDTSRGPPPSRRRRRDRSS